MQFEVIVNQILIIGILVLIGVIATKRKIITTQIKDGIAKIVFDITLPLLIVTTLSNVKITEEILRNSALVIIFSYIGLFALMFAGILSSKILKLNVRTGTIHILHTVLGNIVFLGFPLFNALFPGGEGLLYATLFHLVSSTLMWTWGIYILNKENNSGFLSNLKHLVNPNTIAFVVGLLMMFFGIKFPEVINTPLSGLGKTTIYLSMLYIGAMLAHTHIKGVFNLKHVFILSLNKLIIVPILLLLFINYTISLFGLDLSFAAKTVIIMQVAMPCQATVVILARKFNADDEHATSNIFVSTIISLVTLPFIFYLIQYFS